MLSQLPVDWEEGDREDVDRQICRAGMIAELDAVSFYEQMARQTGNEHLQKVLLDIAKEEKTHIGEFEALLLKFDSEQVQENKNGQKEIEEME